MKRKSNMLLSIALVTYLGHAALLPSLSRAASEQTPEPKTWLSVTDGAEPPIQGKHRDEISFARGHYGVLHLRLAAISGPMEAHWRLYDSSGKVAMELIEPFTPPSRACVVFQRFEPRYRVDRPGRWKWTVSVPSVGSWSREFTLLPPTQLEAANLIASQEASEAVFKVFSQHWLGYGDSFFTLIVDRVASPRGTNDQSMTNVIQTFERGIIQVAHLGYSFGSDHLSEANHRNGLTYAGKAHFNFRVHRYFRFDKGWTPWADTYRADNVFYEAIGRHFAPDVPGEYQTGFNLNFTFEKRDGHWWVWTDGGELYVNGQRLEPPSNRSTEKQQPARDFIALIANKVDRSRVNKRLEGDSVNASPVEIDRNVARTMSMLRGN